MLISAKCPDGTVTHKALLELIREVGEKKDDGFKLPPWAGGEDTNAAAQDQQTILREIITHFHNNVSYGFSKATANEKTYDFVVFIDPSYDFVQFKFIDPSTSPATVIQDMTINKSDKSFVSKTDDTPPIKGADVRILLQAYVEALKEQGSEDAAKVLGDLLARD